MKKYFIIIITLLFINIGFSQDLSLTGGDFSPNPIAVGGTLTINPEITNNGAVEANNSEVRYYLSTNSYISTGDRYLGNSYITLASGETGNLTKDVSLSGVSEGTYYVGVYFTDESEGVAFATTLVVGIVTHDLELNGGSFSSNPVIEDGTFDLNTAIKNNGSSSVTDSEIKYYLSTDDNITETDCYLGNDFVTIDAGGTLNESITVDLSTISCANIGTYYVGVYFVDESYGESLPTTLEINNTGSQNLSLTGGDFSPNPIIVDGILTINPEITNGLSGNADNSEVKYYLSTNSTITTVDRYLGNSFITLVAGETSNLTKDVSISGVSAGTYYVGVYFTDESEGVAFTTTLVVGIQDLTLTGGNVSPNPVVETGTITVSADILNIGGGDAVDTEVKYYLSSNSTITTADIYLGNSILTLNSGSSITDVNDFELSSLTIEAGTYYVGVYFVDESEGVAFVNQLEISENINVNNILQNNDIKFFPIPTNDKLYIQMNNNLKCNVNIYNLQGKLILSEYTEKKNIELDLSIMKKGVYILRILNTLGNIIKEIKIIKD